MNAADSPAVGAVVPWVVKYGGNAMTDVATRRSIAAALGRSARAGRPVVIVHGGGPAIAEAFAARGIESRFVEGRRVTSRDAVDVVETVLTLLGKRLAQEVGDAVALTGRDAALMQAAVAEPALGRVGRMTAVRAEVLRGLIGIGLVPVLACLAVDEAGEALNVNGDEVAGAVAGALHAPVAFLTDVSGVRADPDDPDSVLAELREDEAVARIAAGSIAGGMVPKVRSALEALRLGAPSALIADGRSPEGVRDALVGGTGTRLVRGR